MRAKDAVGQYGERVAASFLTDAGMTILDRNWRCQWGEIDIVALDRDTVVICEVKTRRGLGYGTPAEAVTAHKLSRLRRLAVEWLRAHETHAEHVRIDVIGVVPGRGKPAIEHLQAVG
jgi:putative endonuclease